MVDPGEGMNGGRVRAAMGLLALPALFAASFLIAFAALRLNDTGRHGATRGPQALVLVGFIALFVLGPLLAARLPRPGHQWAVALAATPVLAIAYFVVFGATASGEDGPTFTSVAAELAAFYAVVQLVVFLVASTVRFRRSGPGIHEPASIPRS